MSKYYFLIEDEMIYIFNGVTYTSKKEADTAFKKYFDAKQEYIRTHPIDAISGPAVTLQEQKRKKRTKLIPVIL